MKKLIYFIALLALTRVGAAQTRYSLAVAVGEKGNEPQLYSKVVQSINDSLISVGLVAEENARLLSQPTRSIFERAMQEVSSIASANDILFIPFLVHGTGYNKKFKIPFYGIKTAIDEKFADGKEDSLQILANLFPHDCYSQKDRSLGINKKLVQIIYLTEVRGDSVETEKYGKIAFKYDAYNAYATSLIPQNQGLTVGDRCPVIAQFYFLEKDSDRDGVIDNRQFYIDYFQTGIIGPYINELVVVSDSVFYYQPWGKNQQIDNDPEKLPDQLFCIMTKDGPRLACDLNNSDSTHVDHYYIDLIDMDNDGVFDHGDINQDGDTDDPIEFSSAVYFADGPADFMDIIPILSMFPGRVVLLTGACYGGKHISLLPAGMIGYSFCDKSSEANYYDLQLFAQGLGRSNNIVTLLDIFKLVSWGWLNDNGDGAITQGPWQKGDGYLSSQLFLITAPWSEAVILPMAEFNLHQNYPNPFNPTTTIKYSLPQAETVTLTIYNMLGQKVRDLVNLKQQAGNYSIVWDATDQNRITVPTGVYFYRIEAGSFAKTNKMTLMK